MFSTITPACGYCGRPVVQYGTLVNGIWYHAACTMPPDAPRFEPTPPEPNGCRPLRHLTEQEVRWIVREEIAAIERERVAAQEGKPS